MSPPLGAAEMADRLQRLGRRRRSCSATAPYIFVDGRYTLQVRDQVDLDIFTIESLVDNPPATWIKNNLGKGARLGFDPWLQTIGDVKALKASAEKIGRDIGRRSRTIRSTPSGRTSPNRRWRRSRSTRSPLPANWPRTSWRGWPQAIGKDGATHAVLTDPSSIAWAFNIRGGDVPHTPLALGFAVLAADRSHLLFMDQRKLSRTESRPT